MIAVAIVSLMVPLIVGLATIGIPAGAPRLVSDVRGVALQTVIVIVVLLAIAGAVAGVLITRGGEAVAEAEQQEILVDASDITNPGLCESYGFSWAGGACYRTVPVQRPAEDFTTESACNDYEHLGSKPYTWSPAGDPNGSCS